ncbi:type II toxin-antitoxin system prevent-host-death family antitoxin [Rhodococcoides kroppenstedtii]|uniref:type II toxin-antitoxin system prevent-host-death family antitoxin n=1 Tax=Rhodococcoides kroppenstedtii TaxID=293050 RepID=UPI001BDF10F6|nr:type II toxin-antitoxin system prevent-host-death family antitoxin [Rhodococcus kroppenstedtii]MBT1194033.1 type II toxin-antitoxin system prevent-host-death family antitoxin [Rhodococcus kroppenstedtii]
MRIDTRDMVSVTELGRDLSRRINDASDGRTVVVLKNNQPAAALVSPAEMERLQVLDEREDDLRLLALAVVRMTTDTGTRVDLDDLATELGFDLDALDDHDD